MFRVTDTGGVGGVVLLQVPIKIPTDKQNNVFKASTSCFTSGMIRWTVDAPDWSAWHYISSC